MTLDLKTFEFVWSFGLGGEKHHSREMAETLEDARTNVDRRLNDPRVLWLEAFEVTPELLAKEAAKEKTQQDEIIWRYAQQITIFAKNPLPHPAVRAHLDWIHKVYHTDQSFEEKSHEEQYQEAMDLPNHIDLIPYLNQLPDNCEYAIYDPESSSVVNSQDPKPSEDPFALFSETIGFFHWFQRDYLVDKFGNLSAEYGIVWLVSNPQTQQLALKYELNGCEMSAGINCLVYPKPNL